MRDSSTPATPYEVLGVSAAASMDELRRAYRRRLRETHPDTGGEATAFHAVQVAWEAVGTPEGRALFDAASASVTEAATEGMDGEFVASARADGASPYASAPTESETTPPWERSRPRHAEAEPTARAHGHPGGWNREEYYALMREWVGRGAIIDHPYDSAMVRAAPREIRHLLADANAEEETARTLSRLGISYTIWHDVDSDGAGPGAESKIDHIVLGPTGLFAMLSEDWGGALQVRKGEIVSDVLAVGERPVSSLSRRTRSLTRSTRAKFTALVLVVPDGSTAESLAVVGRERGVPVVVLQQSRLQEFIEVGLAGVPRLGADDIFALRERLHQVIRFI
ncbi:nuclease-like protein [Glaciihabitans tibetensis]|uniref:Nuclease-like protein n=1 Tax=Glaciihabitans tibetensis TaxID=1266600 RepID=A0A2T0VJX5_9MICO|nr:nuclease-related domain-containing protein [Glaciihabitans tibetensis]PRY70493.1 nuclease-like protein [Glaciihabitans tibetensis]